VDCEHVVAVGARSDVHDAVTAHIRDVRPKVRPASRRNEPLGREHWHGAAIPGVPDNTITEHQRVDDVRIPVAIHVNDTRSSGKEAVLPESYHPGRRKRNARPIRHVLKPKNTIPSRRQDVQITVEINVTKAAER
jgi:hypothetical protein